MSDVKALICTAVVGSGSARGSRRSSTAASSLTPRLLENIGLEARLGVEAADLRAGDLLAVRPRQPLGGRAAGAPRDLLVDALRERARGVVSLQLHEVVPRGD